MALTEEEAKSLREEKERLTSELQEEREKRVAHEETLKVKTRERFQQLQERCNGKVADIQAQLAASEEKTGELEKKLAAAEQCNGNTSGIQEKLVAAEAKAGALEEKLEAAEQLRASSIQEVVEKAKGRCQELVARNKELEDGQQHATEELRELTARLHEEEEAADRGAAKLASAAETGEAISAARAQSSMAMEAVERLEAEVSTRDRTLEASSEEASRLADALQHHEALIAEEAQSRSSSDAEAHAEIARLKQVVEQLHSEAAQEQCRYATLAEEHDEATKARDAVREAMALSAVAREEAERLEAELEVRDSRLEGTSEESSRLAAALRHHEALVEEATQRQNSSDSAAAAAHTEMNSLKDAMDQLRAEASQEQSRVACLVREYEEEMTAEKAVATRDTTAQIGIAKAEISQLEAELETHREESTRLAATLKSHEARMTQEHAEAIGASTAESLEAKDCIERLEAEVSSSRAEAEANRAESMRLAAALHCEETLAAEEAERRTSSAAADQGELARLGQLLEQVRFSAAQEYEEIRKESAEAMSQNVEVVVRKAEEDTARLEAEISAQEVRLQASREESTRFADALQRHEASAAELSHRFASSDSAAEAEVSGLRETIDKLRSETSQAELRSERLLDEYHDMERDKANTMTDVAAQGLTFREQAEHFEAEVVARDARLEASDAKVIELTSTLQNHEASAAEETQRQASGETAKEAEIDGLKLAMEQLRVSISEEEESYRTLTMEHEQTRKEELGSTEVIRDLNARSSAAKECIERLEAECTERLEADSKSHNEESAQLAAALRHQEALVAEESVRHASSHSTAQAKIVELEQLVDRVQSDAARGYEEYANENAEARRDVIARGQNAEATIDQLEAEIASQEARLQLSSDESSRLADALQRTEAEGAEECQIRASSSESAHAEASELKDIVEQLRADACKAERRFAALTDEHEDMKKNADEIRKDMAARDLKLEADVERLEAELSARGIRLEAGEEKSDRLAAALLHHETLMAEESQRHMSDGSATQAEIAGLKEALEETRAEASQEETAAHLEAEISARDARIESYDERLAQLTAALHRHEALIEESSRHASTESAAQAKIVELKQVVDESREHASQASLRCEDLVQECAAAKSTELEVAHSAEERISFSEEAALCLKVEISAQDARLETEREESIRLAALLERQEASVTEQSHRQAFDDSAAKAEIAGLMQAMEEARSQMAMEELRFEKLAEEYADTRKEQATLAKKETECLEAEISSRDAGLKASGEESLRLNAALQAHEASREEETQRRMSSDAAAQAEIAELKEVVEKLRTDASSEAHRLARLVEEHKEMMQEKEMPPSDGERDRLEAEISARDVKIEAGNEELGRLTAALQHHEAAQVEESQSQALTMSRARSEVISLTEAMEQMRAEASQEQLRYALLWDEFQVSEATKGANDEMQAKNLVCHAVGGSAVQPNETVAREDSETQSLLARVKDLEAQLAQTEGTHAALQESASRAAETIATQVRKERELQARLALTTDVNGAAIAAQAVTGMNSLLVAASGLSRCFRTSHSSSTVVDPTGAALDRPLTPPNRGDD